MNKFLKFQLSWLLVVLVIITINAACSRIETPIKTHREKITVLIRRSTVIPPIKDIPVASGVIVAREKKGDNYLYSILTASHSLTYKNKYTIVTHDQQEHPVEYEPIDLKEVDDCIDLAILQFSSNKNYSLGKLNYSDPLQKKTPINLIGWANGETLLLVEGKMIDPKFSANPEPNQECNRLAFGNSQKEPMPGMSGGPILNQNSELVGIYVARNLAKTNLGISIQDFRETASINDSNLINLIDNPPKTWYRNIQNTSVFHWIVFFAGIAAIVTLFVTIVK